MRGSLGEFREASIHDLSSVPEAPELGSLSSSSPHHVHQQQRQTQGLKFTRFASPRSASDGLLPQDTYDAGSSKQIASVEKTSRRRSAPSTKNERAANDSDSKDQHYQQPTRKRSSESPRKPSSESSVKRLATSYSTRRLKKKSPTRIIAEDFDEDDEDGNNPAQNEDEIQDHDDTKWGLLLTAFGLDFEDGCCPCRRPGYNRVSSYIVRHAPCFWFCGRSFDVGATDRSILYRLNLLCGFFAFGQIASAVLLAILFYSRSIVDRDDDSVNRRETNAGSLTPNLWNLNGNIFMVGVLAIVIFTTMILTLKVIREVNLRGAIRYMW